MNETQGFIAFLVFNSDQFSRGNAHAVVNSLVEDHDGIVDKWREVWSWNDTEKRWEVTISTD